MCTLSLARVLQVLDSHQKRSPVIMSSIRAALASTAFLSLTMSGAVRAHHAFAAEYDGAKPIDLQGTVTKARWANPHSWLSFDVTAPDGTVTNWGVELGAPNTLALKGLQKADLHAGASVHIKGYRSKNGGEFGYAVTLQLADGRLFQTGGAQDQPAPAAQ